MAQWNEILEGSLNELVTRRLGMQGAAPAPTLMPEMTAALVLENDRPEWSWLKRELLAAGRTGAAAVAGQLGFVELTNPSGSGVLATVESVTTTFLASNGFIKLRNGLAFGGAPAVATVRDGRWILPGATAARPTCTLTGGTRVGAAPEAPMVYMPAATRATYELPIILRPGQTMQVELEVVNIALADVSIAWRERRGLPGELD